MLIKVINPNTTASMTEKVGASARLMAAVGTTIDAVNPSMGPLRSKATTTRRWPCPMLDEIARGEREGADGYALTCFGDPGLKIPVLDLEIPGSPARAVITAQCARVVAEDDCDVIVLGCAGMADLAADISARIGVPVGTTLPRPPRWCNRLLPWA